MAFRVAMLGDVVGRPGKRAVQQLMPELRERYQPDVVIANGENIAGGSGITPKLYRALMEFGVDGVTLGDHALRQREILPQMGSLANLIRPANLPEGAVGRASMVIRGDATCPPLFVFTVLGRIFMNNPLGDDPFAAADRMLKQAPEGAAVLVEIHCETTSEKVAVAHHLDGRVAAVLGTHTHVPTADARILPGGTAFITDLGMTGPYDSVIGRRKDRVLEHMTTGMPSVFEVAEGDVRLCGALVEISGSGRAMNIERIELAADLDQPPFASD